MSDLVDTKLIDGTARTIREVLTGRKYGLDFYQREYTWTEANVSELIGDLTNCFLDDFDSDDERSKVATYKPYFLGPIVTSKVGNIRYLVDGQQRMTSLTLILILLNQLAAGQENFDDLAPLIYSSQYGQKSFNIDVPERTAVMQAILTGAALNLDAADDSSKNIWARYQDLVQLFPHEISDGPLLHFIDWLLERVVLVEIGTTDQDMALEIFESMNDRGLRLSNTDMLKSFLIARIEDAGGIRTANALWRSRVEELNAVEKNADAEFIKFLLRGKYADSIRERKKDATAKDFDLIGTAFHKWVRDNRDKLGLRKASDFHAFLSTEFDRMSRRYLQLQAASTTLTPGMEAVHYNALNGLTLQYLPIMAAVTPVDNDAEFRAKAQLIASYLDLMLARRMVNYRNFGYSTIVYTMFILAKDLRDRDEDEVRAILSDRVAGLEDGFDGVRTFGLTQRNRSHIAYLLARMTDWLDQGHGVGFTAYTDRASATPFEVEHIWANHFDRHKAEFDNPFVFAEKRNRFGDLLLLPKSFNASYGDKSYAEKLPHYFGQNSLARSLHPQAYEHNPAFLALIAKQGLPFKAYPETFTSADIDERQALYQAICEAVWSPERLGLAGGTAQGKSRDFYVSFGNGPSREWADARRYGFISAGSGRWYTQTLNALRPGDRVFVYVPAKGYVGVGVVEDTARAARDLVVDAGDGTVKPLRQMPLVAPGMWHDDGDSELRERAVPVRWLATRDVADAVWEADMFANQNTACRLTHASTVERLVAHFDL